MRTETNHGNEKVTHITGNGWGTKVYRQKTTCEDCGKTVFLVDWSTRCPECQREHTLEAKREHMREIRAAKRKKLPSRCEQCGETIEAQRTTRKYCSDRCRQAAYRGIPARKKRQATATVTSKRKTRG